MQYPQDLELKFNYEFVKQNLQELSEQMEQMGKKAKARMTSRTRVKMIVSAGRRTRG